MCEDNRILEREAKEVSRGIIIKDRLRCIPQHKEKATEIFRQDPELISRKRHLTNKNYL